MGRGRTWTCVGLWTLAAAGVVTCVVGVGPDGIAEQPTSTPKEGPGGGERGRAPRGGLMAQMESFQTTVPAHAYDVILVNPTAKAVTASVVSATEVCGRIEFWRDGSATVERTPTQRLAAGEPGMFVLDRGISADALHHYRWVYTEPDKAKELEAEAGERPAAVREGTLRSFRTPRKAGGAFTFTVQADSHLDANMIPAVYERALENAIADEPDFHVDLGDTFMTDKRRDFREARAQYVAQRYYFGRLCGSAPLFMVLGNHDGEYGYAGWGANEMAGWSYGQRTRLFPPPVIDGEMYTGRTGLVEGRGANYYAFAWGDALVVVLDPFSGTVRKMRGPGGRDGASETALTDESWGMTLGKAQYDWLGRTLEASKAPLKFVFIHHLVGGRGRAARGGVEAAGYFEWGGKNADGTEGFAAHRPGWAMPVQSLLVKHGVTAVFHGHDHLYVKNELDGVVYQCVPQPGNARGGTGSAAEYGYVGGAILPSPGHLRVRVADGRARVEYVRAALGERGARANAGNGAVMASYELRPAEGRPR